MILTNYNALIYHNRNSKESYDDFPEDVAVSGVLELINSFFPCFKYALVIF